MNSIVDSDIQWFVACLVLGYLENQQLQKAYTSFYETSRHLAKEKKGLKYGSKTFDTSIGLANIIREYFSIKARINEFLRISTQSPIIIQLIDTNDTLRRLDIILKAFKESLNKTDSVPGENVKKRKHESPNVFDVSQTKTSIPETMNPSKRPRKSLTTPFLTISDNKENKSRSIDKASTSRIELKYSSTSDTSEKEDDSVEEGKVFSPSPASPESTVLTVKLEQQLSETFLKKPEFAENFAEIINESLLAGETEPKLSDLGSQEILITDDDTDNILSGTQKEMSFDDIVKILVKDIYPPNQDSAGPSHRCETVLIASKDSELHEEIPIKQRNEKNYLPSERKKKMTIISNEPYTGVIPAVANMTRFTSTYSEVPQFVLNLPSYLQSGLEMIPVIQTVPSMIPSVIASTSGIVTNASSETLTTTTSRDIVQVQPTSFASEVTSNITIVAEKKQTTAKVTLYPSFLNSKCRSTTRRKATHVRTLDFTQTPSYQKLESVKQFSTPNNGIQQATPGSAPATIGLFKSAHKEVADTNIVKIEVVPDAEDNSNSNSVSKTPKVAKNPRRRKIAYSKTEKMTKLEAESKSAEKELDKPLTLDPEKPFSIADWKEMRLKSKTMTIDQQVRSVYEKAESNGSVKKRRKAKKPLTTKQQALKNKLSNKSPVELKGKMKSPLKKAPKNTTKKEKSSSEEIKGFGAPKIKFRILPKKRTVKNSPKKTKKNSTEPPILDIYTNHPDASLLERSETSPLASKFGTGESLEESIAENVPDVKQEEIDIISQIPEQMSKLEQQMSDILVLEKEIPLGSEQDDISMKDVPIEPKIEETSVELQDSEALTVVVEVTNEKIGMLEELIDDAPFVRRSRRLQSIHLETFPIKTEEIASVTHSANILTEKQTTQVSAIAVSESVQKSENDDNLPSTVNDLKQENIVKPLEELRTKVEHTDIRLKRYETIRDNIYSKKSDKKVCKINKTMKCDCTITEEEVKNGEMGCQYNCINRILYIECGLKCRCGEYCDNRQFQRYNYAGCSVFETTNKGFGIRADHDIPAKTFIIEYVGEVLDNKQFEKRAKKYSEDKNIHYYFMTLRSNAIIDATKKGNISRFINHSCDPNAETQKWTVNGELRVGFFSRKDIKQNEEITFDYQYQRYGKKAQKCLCEAENCRGWIGENPLDEEEEAVAESPEIDKNITKKTKARKGRNSVTELY